MFKEDYRESIAKAFKRRERGAKRPHQGPSGESFEAYKQGGSTDLSGASFNVEQEFKPEDLEKDEDYEESRSLVDTFESQGIVERVINRVHDAIGNQQEYVDLGAQFDGLSVNNPSSPSNKIHSDVDFFNPSEYNRDPIQDWIDEQLEDGNTEAVRNVKSAEEKGKQRASVTGYKSRPAEGDLDEITDLDLSEKMLEKI